MEVIGKDAWQRYEDDALVAEGENPLGVVPVVHIQNMPLPHQYEGQSDVVELDTDGDNLPEQFRRGGSVRLRRL